MSDERIVSGPWPPGPWRPPVGTWPPPPPPFPRPPDFFSWFFWLNQNYEDAKQAKEFFKRILSDLLADDPTLLSNRQATVGVTDGSDAQPGMVGEYIRFDNSVNVDGSGLQVFVLTMGVVQPGDWDYWLYARPQGFAMNDLQMQLDPLPAGFNDVLWTIFAAPGAPHILTLTSTVGRALISVPSLVSLQIAANSQGPTGVAGQVDLSFKARRRR